MLTGHDLARAGPPPTRWPLERPPLFLETSLPGVFAAGDVRHRSVKRVASAVGEGAIAVQLAHEYLAEQATRTASGHSLWSGRSRPAHAVNRGRVLAV